MQGVANGSLDSPLYVYCSRESIKNRKYFLEFEVKFEKISNKGRNKRHSEQISDKKSPISINLNKKSYLKEQT